MEKQERFVIEVFLGVILVVFLIMLIFLFTGVSGKTQTTTVITNSYNTNTYTSPTPSYSSYNPTYSSYRPLTTRPSYRDPYSKPYIVSNPDYPYANKVYYVKDDIRYTKSDDRYLRYQDFGQHRTVKGIFGNNINRYEVYVRNRDYLGGYFTVRFNFEDYYGRTSSYSITNYIKPQEEKRFLFKDISGDTYNYGWRYEVIPRTKAPTSVYYNSYSPRTIEKLIVTSVAEVTQTQFLKEFTIEGSEVAEVTQTQALKEFTIEGSEFKFNPKSISVNKGDRVRITFKNTGSISHNFGIPLLGVRSRTISSGASDTIEFVADKSGTFDFDCSIPGHRSLGMNGQLIIKGEQSTNQQTSFPSTSSYGFGY